MAGKTVIGNLVVSLLGDNTKLDKALKGSQKQIKGFTKFGLAAGVMLGNLAAKGIAVLAKASIQAVKKLARFTKELVVNYSYKNVRYSGLIRWIRKTIHNSA